jgi:hypothetical protein
MTPESFPGRRQDGEEPDSSRPLPAGWNEPEDGFPGSEQGLFVCLPAEELTLAGFAQNGRSDTMAPGPLLATVLEAITGEDGSGLAALADDQLMGVLSGIRRMEARAAWGQLAVLAELARRRPATEPGDTGQYGFSDYAPDEVAAELRLSHQSAASQMIYAAAVADRLPRSFAALAAGQIHAVHLRIIDDETRILSPELAAAADEILAEKAESATFGELRYAAHRLVLKLDPDAARKRKEAAAKHEAEVRRFRESSGNAGMIARELPPAEVLASWQHVDQRAHDLRTAGMPGSLRELRIQAYLDLLQERDSRLAPVGSDRDGSGSAGPDGNGGPQRGDDGVDPRGNGGSGRGPRSSEPAETAPGGNARQAGPDKGLSVAALINITVQLDTLLGLSATPGEAAGYGLLDPSDARDLVAAAARHPDTRWCVTALHPDGTAAAHGCARGRHPPPPVPGPTRPGGGPSDPDPPPDHSHPTDIGSPPDPDPPPGGRVRDYLAGLRIRMIPVARGHCDHTRAESGYRPSHKLQHLVKVRNARCTAPGCGRPAARCDLDHTVAWDQGGLTCECDLAPLCRHHHRCKQSQGWKLEQTSPGVLRWETPAGRTYTTTPTAYPA